MPEPLITVSVVSHAQNELVNQLLPDLARHGSEKLHILVTENVPDSRALELPAKVTVDRIVNAVPKGFGVNHNAAFACCRTEYFCVANPDIRLPSDPFVQLRSTLD